MRELNDRQQHLELCALENPRWEYAAKPMPWTPININSEGLKSEEKMSLAMYPPTKHYVESL